MNSEKIVLKILEISNHPEQEGTYILLLGDDSQEYRLPISIGSREAQDILMERRGIYPVQPTLQTVFAAFLSALDYQLLYILIHRITDKLFNGYLYLRKEEQVIRVDARITDAIVLALKMNAPIYTYKKTDEEHTSNLFTCATDDTLQLRIKLKERELQEAIQREAYEQAAQLRDEIQQLKQS